MKVAINHCIGGFSLSDKAFEELIKMGWKTSKDFKGEYSDIVMNEHNGCKYYKFCNFIYDSSFEFRKDERLIQMIEKLGEEANGESSNIKIVEIPDGTDGYIFEGYSGFEWIHEKHRVWGYEEREGEDAKDIR